MHARTLGHAHAHIRTCSPSTRSCPPTRPPAHRHRIDRRHAQPWSVSIALVQGGRVEEEERTDADHRD
eukprot:10025329-Alexandrium_andersonii.AAC.1